MLLSDPSNFDKYRSGNLNGHVLALRPIQDLHWDILVTDYTQNVKLKEKSTDHENKLGLSEDLKITLKISSGLCRTIIDEYKYKTGIDLFLASNVDMEKSRWIEVSDKFCFVKLEIRLKKSLVGFVNSIKLVHSGDAEFCLFWDRMYKCIGETMNAIPPLLINSLRGCIDLKQLNSLTLKEDPTMVHLPDSSQNPDPHPTIKQEDLGNNDSQRLTSSVKATTQDCLFKLTLECLSQENENSIKFNSLSTGHLALKNGGLPLQTQTNELLTQLDNSQNQAQAMSNFLESHSERTAFFMQLPSSTLRHQHRDEAHVPSITSIADLKQDPYVPDGKIYRLRARIIGHFPKDLNQLCTKLYLCDDLGVRCSGPRIQHLKFVLSDTKPGKLASSDSVVVCIPKESLLNFFSYKHIEQLYTQLSDIVEDLKSVVGKDVLAELFLDSHDGRTSWIWRNLTLKSLLES